MGPAEPPLPVDADEAAVAPALLDQDVHRDLAGVHGIAGHIQDVEDPACEHHADDGLAIARARYAARRALGVGATADERGVAHSPGRLAGHASSGGGGGDQSAAIEG